MENKQWQIYLRRKPGHPIEERVPVTEEFFREYYRDIDAYRRKQQRHGRCSCPRDRQLWCDMDCETCPYREHGDIDSLNVPVCEEDENGMKHSEAIDLLDDPSSLFAGDVEDSITFQTVLQRIAELMPEALEIGYLREQGMSDTAISAKINIPRMTFAYRLLKLKESIDKEFFEFL